MVNCKPKRLIAILCSMVVMSAHADMWSSIGDDGNPNTIGNAGAKKSHQSKSVAIPFILNVVNNTNAVLTTGIVRNSAGKTLFTTAKGKKCDLGTVCQIALDRRLIDKNSTMFFYDGKGNLVSAFMLSNLNKTDNMYNASVDMDSLGRYVLAKVQKLNPKVSYDTVDMNIVTTTLPATPYEELADYYLDLLGSGKDDTSVIKFITKQMSANTTIAANSQSIRLMAKNNPKTTGLTRSNMKLATASATSKAILDSKNPLCSTTLSKVMTTVGGLGFPGAGIITGIAKGITAACPNPDKQYLADQFTKIDAQFNTISLKLVDIQNDLARIGQNVTKYAVYSQIQTIENNDNTLFNWVRAYNEILSYPGSDGKHYGSLKELINSYGGLDSALTKIPNLRQNLSKLYDDKQVMEIVQSLGGSILTHTSSQIIDLCGNANTISGDVIAIRMWCNVQSFDIYARNAVLASFIPSINDDVKTIYDADKDPNKKARWGIPEADLDKFTKVVNSNFNPEQNSKIIIPTIKDTDPVYALSQNLLAQKFSVVEWNNGEKYLTTSILDTTAVNKESVEIRSRYYYAEPKRSSAGIEYTANAKVDEDVVSIMGVPVPKRFFNGGSQNNYGYDPAFPWAEYSQIYYANGDNGFDDLSLSSNFVTPNTVAVATYGFNPGQFNGAYISQGSYTEKFTRNNKSYQRRIFTPSKSGSNFVYSLRYDGADYWQVADGEFFSFMRYQMPDGNSRVWAVRTKMRRDTGAGFYINATPQCVTNDCRTENTGRKMDKVIFQNGQTPFNIEWDYTALRYNTAVDYFTLMLNGKSVIK